MSRKLGRLEIALVIVLEKQMLQNVVPICLHMKHCISHQCFYRQKLHFQKIEKKNWYQTCSLQLLYLFFSFFSSQKVVPPAPLDPKGPWYPKLQIPRAKSDAFHTQAWYKQQDSHVHFRYFELWSGAVAKILTEINQFQNLTNFVTWWRHQLRHEYAFI